MTLKRVTSLLGTTARAAAGQPINVDSGESIGLGVLDADGRISLSGARMQFDVAPEELVVVPAAARVVAVKIEDRAIVVVRHVGWDFCRLDRRLRYPSRIALCAEAIRVHVAPGTGLR